MIRYLLWDLDATILNFEKAEEYGIREGLKEIGCETCSEQMLARYAAINRTYWERLERQEITKPEVLVGRFQEFFEKEGISGDPKAFNQRYQSRLGDVVIYNDDCRPLLERLEKEYEQYIVTNGTKDAQDKKLAKSGLGALMDGCFISEEIGHEKPSTLFFDAVLQEIGRRHAGEPVKKEEILIIGDSLTSDMRGGTRAGIRTCWYNPAGVSNPYPDVRIDRELRSLQELPDILEDWKKVEI